MIKRLLLIAVFVFMSAQSQAATYYLRADGTNADSDCSGSSACCAGSMDMADFNAAAFSGNDIINVCDDGGIFRTAMVVNDSGSSGNPITIQKATGDSPILSGGNALSSWTEESTNIWYASFSVNPDGLFFYETDNSLSWGFRESLKANVGAEYDFWFDDPNNRVYVYSTQDPGTAYTTVEGAVRQNVISSNGSDYIVIDGLELRSAGAGSADNEIIGLTGVTDGWEIKNCWIRGSGHKEATERGDSIQITGGSNFWVHNNTIEESGRHLVYLYASSGNIVNAIVEKNILRNGYHTHFDNNGSGSFNITGTVFRYNFVEFNGTDLDGNPGGTFHNGNGGTISNLHIYGNIWVGGMFSILNVNQDVAGLFYYNNSAYITFSSGGSSCFIVESTGISDVNFFNNNTYAPSVSQIYNWNSGTQNDANYNVYYKPSGTFAYVGSSYAWADYRTTFSEDANSYFENPDFTNGAGNDLTLQTGVSPGEDTGVDLGATYDDGLDPTSTWPDNVSTLDRDSFTPWDIGAFEIGSVVGVDPTGIRRTGSGYGMKRGGSSFGIR